MARVDRFAGGIGLACAPARPYRGPHGNSGSGGMIRAAAHEEIDGGGRLLLLCDHATNIVPPEVGGGSLGLPPEEMQRHIAYDIGARAVTLELARLLGAPAVLTRFSRLVIDPNRGEDDPTLVMRLYDGTIIGGNRQVSAAEVARRLAAYHRPYHAAIAATIDRLARRRRRRRWSRSIPTRRS